METRQFISCDYHDYERKICFHCIGYGKAGGEMALGFQFAGGSSKGLASGGEWRCFDLSSVRNAKLHDGPWRSGSSHTKIQVCVKDIHFEVMG
jgi:hypothetical protein